MPAATAQTTAPTDPSTLTDSGVSSVQETTANQTQTVNASTTSDGSSSETSNYTKLYVESDYDHPDLKPGESTEFTVTVTNREDSEVTLDPHVYIPPTGENLIKKSWVTIEGDSTVGAGSETEFSVTISVPESAETGHYSGQVAFTDETVTYPGRPARPVHAASVRINVWKKPTVEIVSGTYVTGQVEAGDTATKQIVIKNTGDQAVPLSPQLSQERHRYGGSSSQLDPAWLDIDAPSTIELGETATVSVTVSPPESADSNRYSSQLDLGLKDPNRDGNNNHWQQINLNFEVWNQPEEPFTTSFEVSEETENITLTLGPRTSYYSSTDTTPSFDVTFVAPDGTMVTAKRVEVTNKGFVDLSESNNPNVQQQGAYGVRGDGKKFVYRVDDPDAGAWNLKVMPENAIGFTYEITRNENEA
ncbi:COG1470 family protein [Halorussus salinus]|uniref:COG1470 family protein n=1 Tax=Halorussus salinus TaxID=1364935 RepID=UPI00192F1E7F|nr:hypothetical protein [Halorussus salinus]